MDGVSAPEAVEGNVVEIPTVELLGPAEYISRQQSHCLCCQREIKVMSSRGTGYCGQLCENGGCGHANSNQFGTAGAVRSDTVSYGGSCGT